MTLHIRVRVIGLLSWTASVPRVHDSLQTHTHLPVSWASDSVATAGSITPGPLARGSR